MDAEREGVDSDQHERALGNHWIPDREPDSVTIVLDRPVAAGIGNGGDTHDRAARLAFESTPERVAPYLRRSEYRVELLSMPIE